MAARARGMPVPGAARRMSGGVRARPVFRGGAGTKSGQGDRDEAERRGLGRQAAGRGEGMQAVARELAGRDVVADTAVAHAVGQQLLDHAVELPPGPDDLRVAVQEGRQTTFVMTSGVVRGEGEGPQYRLELFTGVRALIADLDQVLEVVADLALVPGEQDRLDIGKVLVQRGAPDPG